MKKLFVILLSVLNCESINAQSVGIGTTTPDAKAQLDISSTTKGLLIPSLTNAQMFAIAGAATGLIVYNNERELLCMYDGSAWKSLLNNSYWTRPVTGRDNINNLNDSIGIGTNSPDELLDVNGTINGSEIVRTDGDIITAGQAGTGKAILNNDVAVFGDLQIDNAFGTLKFSSGSSEQASVALSNYDLRLTNNTADGEIIFRNGGTNRVIIGADGNTGIGVGPISGSKLTVGGNMYSTADVGGVRVTMNEVNTDFISNTTQGAGNNLLPLCYGSVSNNSNAAVLKKTNNCSISYSATNKYYTISCQGISTNSIMLATLLPDETTQMHTIYIVYDSPGKARVYTYTRQVVFPTILTPGADSFIPNDYGFHFIIYR